MHGFTSSNNIMLTYHVSKTMVTQNTNEVNKGIHFYIHVSKKQFMYTVKPPKRGHFGVGLFVLCREVVLLCLNATENLILIENRVHISIP